MSEDLMFTPTSLVARSDAQVSCLVDGSMVLMNVERDEFYDLNETASAVWEVLSEPRSFVALCDELLEAFDVDRATCEASVSRLLADLVGRGMVDVSGGTSLGRDESPTGEAGSTKL